MEKTEMMKRYEAETGKGARGELYSSSIKLCMPTNDYIAWLEAQLTWRPVDYPPKVDGEYLCRWAGSGRFIALYKNKTWFVWDDELEEHVKLKYLPYMYLTIPPAPKGE